MFSMAMWMATLVAPIQILAGDQHGLNTLEHQPAKVMAMEGHFTEPSRRRAADPVRPARPGRGQGEIRDRDSEAGVADPQAFASTRRCRPRHRAARKLAAGADRVLVVPDHGRARASLMLGLGLCSLWARWRGSALRLALAARLRAGDGAGGLRRRDRGLGHDRGRAPAVHRLRPAAHRRSPPRRWRRPRSARRCSPSSSSISSSSARALTTCCG